MEHFHILHFTLLLKRVIGKILISLLLTYGRFLYTPLYLAAKNGKYLFSNSYAPLHLAAKDGY